MQQPQIFAAKTQRFEISKKFAARFPDFLPGTGKNGRLSGQGKARGGGALPNATPRHIAAPKTQQFAMPENFGGDFAVVRRYSPSVRSAMK
jgi:hypothetical protein